MLSAFYPMADKEDLLSAFRDHINTLDLDDFTDQPRLPDIIKNANIQHLDAGESTSLFTYNIDIGLARLRTQIDTDFRRPTVRMQFPSRVEQFFVEDMLQAITSLFDAAHANTSLRQTPHVALNDGKSETRFDLRDAWQNDNYKNALRLSVERPSDFPIESLVYYTPPQLSSFQASLGMTPEPDFMYGFQRTSFEGVREFVKMTHAKASYMDLGFASELLSRNSGYRGQDIRSDAGELRSSLQMLCKHHPQQSALS